MNRNEIGAVASRIKYLASMLILIQMQGCYHVTEATVAELENTQVENVTCIPFDTQFTCDCYNVNRMPPAKQEAVFYVDSASIKVLPCLTENNLTTYPTSHLQQNIKK